MPVRWSTVVLLLRPALHARSSARSLPAKSAPRAAAHPPRRAGGVLESRATLRELPVEERSCSGAPRSRQAHRRCLPPTPTAVEQPEKEQRLVGHLEVKYGRATRTPAEPSPLQGPRRGAGLGATKTSALGAEDHLRERGLGDERRREDVRDRLVRRARRCGPAAVGHAALFVALRGASARRKAAMLCSSAAVGFVLILLFSQRRAAPVRRWPARTSRLLISSRCSRHTPGTLGRRAVPPPLGVRCRPRGNATPIATQHGEQRRTPRERASATSGPCSNCIPTGAPALVGRCGSASARPRVVLPTCPAHHARMRPSAVAPPSSGNQDMTRARGGGTHHYPARRLVRPRPADARWPGGIGPRRSLWARTPCPPGTVHAREQAARTCGCPSKAPSPRQTASRQGRYRRCSPEDTESPERGGQRVRRSGETRRCVGGRTRRCSRSPRRSGRRMLAHQCAVT